MTKLVKFLYVMAIFLSVIFIAMNDNPVIRCITDLNCPPDMCPSNKIAKCKDAHCKCMQLQSHGRGIFFPHDYVFTASSKRIYKQHTKMLYELSFSNYAGT
ncbi:uncharacterized protein LOC131615005 [Vicia villosa]|uniref:uncharacterized protein LOC131615005 n=1 Tax=Vicia villosa TaxID=3911 RepID=UPI00273B6534|nr:uncharacterized protein LOC131615005 [Vicia villosa]